MPDPLDIFGLAPDPLDFFGAVSDPLDFFGDPEEDPLERLRRNREIGRAQEARMRLPPPPGQESERNPLLRRVGSEALSGMLGLAAMTPPARVLGAVESLLDKDATAGERALAPLRNPLARAADEMQQSAGWGHPGGDLRDEYIAYQLGHGASPLAAAGMETVGAVAGLADPTDLIPGGALAGPAALLARRGSRRLSQAAERAGLGTAEDAGAALLRAERAVDAPRLVEVASGSTGRAQIARITEMTKEGDASRTLVAFDRELRPLGDFEFFDEASQIRPFLLTTGKRGSGVGRALYREAVRLAGKKIGPAMSYSDEGAAFTRRMFETNRDLFLDDVAPRDLLPIGTKPKEGKFRPPETPFQYNAQSLDLPRRTLPEIKETMESPRTLARRRTGIKIDYDDPKALERELGLREDDFLQAPAGTVWNREAGALLDSYIGKYGRRMEELRPRVLAGQATEGEAAEFGRVKEKWIDLLGASMANRSETGRALESYRHLRAALDTPGALRDHLARKLGKKLKAEDLDLLATVDLDNPGELASLISKIQKPKWWEYPRELFYSSILSGLGTHGRNTIGNALHAASQVPVRFGKAVIDVPMAKLQGRQREYYFREILPSLVGLAEGASDGLVRFGRAWHHADKIFEQGSMKFDVPRSAFARSPNRFVRERVAPVVNIPFKALYAADELFKGINRGAELRALAVRSGIKDGKRGGELADHVSLFMADPPEWALERAVKFEQKMTFTNPLGPVARHLEKLKNESPFLGYLVPFVRTPVNLFKRGVEFTPLNLPRALLMARRGEVEASEELAKVGVGTAFMVFAGMKATQGELTGPPPSEAGERDAYYQQGKRPFSVRFGDRWYGFSQIEPLAFPLALTAAAWEGFRRGDKGDATHFERLQSAMALLLANQLDRSYLSGLGDLVELKTYGERALTSFAGRQAAALGVPFSGAWRSVANAIDPRVVEKRSIGDFFRENIPGLKGQLPARQTRFGEDISKTRWEAAGPSGTPAVPVRVTDDEIENALADLGLQVGFPGKSIEGVELSPEEYRVYLREAGQRTKNVLGTLLFDKTFRELPQADQQKVLDRFAEGTRDQVKAEALFGSIPEIPPLYIKRQLAGEVDIFNRIRGRNPGGASAEFNEATARPGQTSVSEMRAAQQEAEEKWAPAYAQLKEAVSTARRQGLDDQQIIALLRKKGIATRIARAVVAGKDVTYSQYRKRTPLE